MAHESNPITVKLFSFYVALKSFHALMRLITKLVQRILQKNL